MPKTAWSSSMPMTSGCVRPPSQPLPIYRYPHDSSYISWHQDGHYWGLSAPGLVSAWIALSDSTPANGCMRAWPGSHRQQLHHNQR
jgi:ectoine hydroxylase-related dioxygenase (phytanoyl-CoA dioxygenase family)